MPEGDTLFRTAATLSKAIGGKVVRRLSSQLSGVSAAAPDVEGRPIERVEAMGKNLLIHFGDGSALLTHMRMTGSWHIYRPGERWQKSERAARVVIETDDFVAVCFAAPVVELIPKGGVEGHPALSRLGPDILKEDFDLGLARSRLRERPGVGIAEALLMQGALAGIGNVYKSEVLFLCRIDPWVKVEELSDEVLDGAIAKARELMLQNLDGGPRTTTMGARGARGAPGARGAAGSGGLRARGFVAARGPRSWVYDRAGEGCLACGAKIRAARGLTREAAGGEAARVTFYCPRCQPPGARGQAPSGE